MSEQQANGRPWWRDHPWLGGHLFVENRGNNIHLLEPYERKWVAWNPDGSGIRDADVDHPALWNRIEASGDDPSWYQYEYVSFEEIF